MCINCHNGPLFTNHGFQNVGIPIAKGLGIDEGRYRGLLQAKSSEFNCLGKYSDAGENDCAELRFAQMSRDEIVGAFKVPTLRNVADTAPYTHSGEYATLAEAIEHYDNIPVAPIGYTELFTIRVTDNELQQLEAFLRSLSGPPVIAPALLVEVVGDDAPFIDLRETDGGTYTVEAPEIHKFVDSGDDIDDDILTMAKDHDVDVLVVGSHGHNAFQGLLGSTGARIVRRSEVPVLVLR